jgi:hypothetical protein
MAEIIEVLAPLYAELPFFEIDHTATAVPVQYPRTPAFFYNANGLRIFRNIDNIIILSCGFVFPDNFVQANTAKTGTISPTSIMTTYLYKYSDLVTPVGFLPGFGDNASFSIPMENYEISIGIFSNITSAAGALAGENFVVGCSMACNDVSMIGVPTAFLNNDVVKLIPFIKIIHNMPLQAEPPI